MMSATEFYLQKVKRTEGEQIYNSTDMIEALEAFEIYLIDEWRKRIETIATTTPKNDNKES